MKSPQSSDCQQNKLAWDWQDKTLGVINVDEYVVLVLKELIICRKDSDLNSCIAQTKTQVKTWACLTLKHTTTPPSPNISRFEGHPQGCGRLISLRLCTAPPVYCGQHTRASFVTKQAGKQAWLDLRRFIKNHRHFHNFTPRSFPHRFWLHLCEYCSLVRLRLKPNSRLPRLMNIEFDRLEVKIFGTNDTMRAVVFA